MPRPSDMKPHDAVTEFVASLILAAALTAAILVMIWKLFAL